MDRLTVDSAPGRGTVVEMWKWVSPMAIDGGRFGPIEWAAAARPLSSAEECGDQPAAVDVSGSAVLFGVLDGLGHGSEAARAAACGLEVLRRDPAKPLGVLVQLCHRAIADTRGGAMTLA